MKRLLILMTGVLCLWANTAQATVPAALEELWYYNSRSHTWREASSYYGPFSCGTNCHRYTAYFSSKVGDPNDWGTLWKAYLDPAFNGSFDDAEMYQDDDYLDYFDYANEDHYNNWWINSETYDLEWTDEGYIGFLKLSYLGTLYTTRIYFEFD